jgi:hypothetical protein
MTAFVETLGKSILSRLHRAFRRRPTPAPGARSQRHVRPAVEVLEDRALLSPVSTVNIGSGFNFVAYHLANTGALTASGIFGAVTLDMKTAAFNIDPTGTDLWDLETNGQLWHRHNSAWTREDTTTGDIRMAPNGTLYDLEITGQLWRWQNGKWDSAPLASGISRFDTDANNNLYALQDGTLFKWNNAGIRTTGDTQVVSFAVGGTTLAYQRGYLGPSASQLSRLVLSVTFPDGSIAGSDLLNNGVDASAAEYGVTADGDLWVLSDNAGNPSDILTLARLAFPSVSTFNADVDRANNANSQIVTAAGSTGSSFEVSPDESTVVVAAELTVSSYTRQGNPAGWAETVLDNAGNLGTHVFQVVGVANDNQIYNEYAGQTDASLVKYPNPTSSSSTLIAHMPYTLQQLLLGPNGQLSFLDVLGRYWWSNDANVSGRQIDTSVLQIGTSVTGRQYELEASGHLYAFDGTSWSLLSSQANTFTLAGTGQLYETESNGELWRLTTTWTDLGSGIRLGGSLGAASLFALPDGVVAALLGNNLTEFTPGMTTVVQGAVTFVTWGVAAFGFQGDRIFIAPLADPWLPDGAACSWVSPIGTGIYLVSMSPGVL